MKKLSPFILIIIAIASFFMFIDPQYNEVKALQSTKADNDTMLGLAQELQNKRDRLHSAFNSISAGEKEKLQKLLPNTVDNVRLILDINNIAQDHNVIIRNITVQGGDEEESPDDSRRKEEVKTELSSEIGVITLSFSMIASYEVFMDFLKDLEQALRLVDIQRLTITADEGDFMNFNITLNTYWLR